MGASNNNDIKVNRFIEAHHDYILSAIVNSHITEYSGFQIFTTAHKTRFTLFYSQHCVIHLQIATCALPLFTDVKNAIITHPIHSLSLSLLNAHIQLTQAFVNLSHLSILLTNCSPFPTATLTLVKLEDVKENTGTKYRSLYIYIAEAKRA